jgi:hypothetical protein
MMQQPQPDLESASSRFLAAANGAHAQMQLEQLHAAELLVPLHHPVVLSSSLTRWLC